MKKTIVFGSVFAVLIIVFASFTSVAQSQQSNIGNYKLFNNLQPGKIIKLIIDDFWAIFIYIILFLLSISDSNFPAPKVR